MREAVEALRRAAHREEARRAASDLVRVPGRAGEVVAAVRVLVEDGVPWVADALGVLLHVLARIPGEHEDADRVRAVHAALAGFDGQVRVLIVDPDPETRSIACLLLGRISAEAAVDLDLLRMVGAGESDERVRACTAEAGLRLGGVRAFDLLADPSDVVRHRVARLLVPRRHGANPAGLDPAVADLARSLLAERPTSSASAWLWPAEQL